VRNLAWCQQRITLVEVETFLSNLELERVTFRIVWRNFFVIVWRSSVSLVLVYVNILYRGVVLAKSLR